MIDFRKLQGNKNKTLLKSSIIRECWRMKSPVIFPKNRIGNNPELQTSKFYFSIEQTEGEIEIVFGRT